MEEFEGFVEQIIGKVAYITLKDSNGEEFWGEIPVEELKGMGERSRFKVRTEIIPIPPKEITDEDYKKIDKLLSALPDDQDLQDDY